MAFCRKCGNTLSDSQLFCPKCGEAVKVAATPAASVAATPKSAVPAAPPAPVAPAAAVPPAPPAPYAPMVAPVQAGRKSRKGLWIGLGALAAVVVIIVVCVAVIAASGGATGPEQTVQKMLTAMAAKDVDAFLSLLDSQGIKEITPAGMSVDDFKSQVAEGALAFDSVEFSNIKMRTVMADDGQTAVVTLVEGVGTMVGGDAPTVKDYSVSPKDYPLILRDGKWYVDVTSLAQ
jgi:hypothetical protein